MPGSYPAPMSDIFNAKTKNRGRKKSAGIGSPVKPGGILLSPEYSLSLAAKI